MCKKIKKLVRGIKKRLVQHVIITSGLSLLGLIGILYLIDYAAPYLSSMEHNISGSIWFSAIASLFSVISSFMMGLFAMRQTDRLNELQEYYRRPALVLEKTELKMDFINYRSYSSQCYSFQVQKIIADCKELEKNINYAWMQIVLKLVLRNDIGINSFLVEKMIFIIGSKKYTFINRYKKDTEEWTTQNEKLRILRKFQYTFRATHEEYDIHEALIHLAPDNAEVWNALMQVSQSEISNPEYETVGVEIVARLDFITEVERSEMITIKAILGKPERIDNAVYKITADSGKIIYKEIQE